MFLASKFLFAPSDIFAVLYCLATKLTDKTSGKKRECEFFETDNQALTGRVTLFIYHSLTSRTSELWSVMLNALVTLE